MGLRAAGHGLVLGPAEGALDVVQFRAGGRQIAELDAQRLQFFPGVPDHLGAVRGGVVQDHHARETFAWRQGVAQAGEHVFALPGPGGHRPPGQGRQGRLAGCGLDCQHVHTLTLGTLVGDHGPMAASAPAVGGGLGQGEAAFIEAEEPQLVGKGFCLRSSSSTRAAAAAAAGSCRWRRT